MPRMPAISPGQVSSRQIERGELLRQERLQRPGQLVAALACGEETQEPLLCAGPLPGAAPFGMLCAADIDIDVAQQWEEHQGDYARQQARPPHQFRLGAQHEPQQRRRDEKQRHHVRQCDPHQEGQRQQVPIAALPLPAKRQQHDRQRPRHRRRILLGGHRVIPEEIGEAVEGRDGGCNGPTFGVVLNTAARISLRLPLAASYFQDQPIHQPEGDQRPKRGVTRQDRQWIVVAAQDQAAEVEPEPAAHRVERITRRVAGPALHLRVLVRDQVASLQLTGAQAVVQGEQIERGKEDHEHDPGQCRGSRPPGPISDRRRG